MQNAFKNKSDNAITQKKKKKKNTKYKIKKENKYMPNFYLSSDKYK